MERMTSSLFVFGLLWVEFLLPCGVILLKKLVLLAVQIVHKLLESITLSGHAFNVNSPLVNL